MRHLRLKKNELPLHYFLEDKSEGTESPLFVSMDLKEKIKELTQANLADNTHFLVDVIVSRHRPMKFSIILDGDKGITIDDCALLSNKVNDALSNLVEEQYSLEVSTPGLDHPLKLHRQFVKNVGRGLKVHTSAKKVIAGKLASTEAEKIILETEVKEGKRAETKLIEIPFTEIEKAFVTVSFK
jgi:ribosome maturation factor RimP